VTKNGIQWSAVPDDVSGDTGVRVRYADQYQRFFNTYDDELTIIKGLDCLTISHSIGSRAKLTGRVNASPGLAALYAAAHAPKLPLSFLTFGSQFGGTDVTTGLNVTKALLGTDGNLISELATPGLGQNTEVNDIVKGMHLQRLQRQIETEKGSGLPLRAQKLEELLHQRTQENLFLQLRDNLDQLNAAAELEPAKFHWYPELGHSDNFKTQAAITAASIATGLSCSASLTLKGFDSHNNNDGRQFLLLSELVEGINYLVNVLDFYGLAEKTTIVVASDIGRTPHYNGANGKDHSIYGGMMVLHSKGSGRGGKVFGSSDNLSRGMTIDLNTGLPHENGTRLNVRHMMVALNEFLGLSETARRTGLDFDSSVLMPSIF